MRLLTDPPGNVFEKGPAVTIAFLVLRYRDPQKTETLKGSVGSKKSPSTVHPRGDLR
jgi:hypothetical protein